MDIKLRTLPRNVYRLHPSGHSIHALNQAVHRLANTLPQLYWPLQISVPDPAAIFQIMEFDVLPGSMNERDDIARFRMEKEWPAVAQMECTTQVAYEGKKSALLLAMAIQNSWLRCLRDACRLANWVPGVIDIAVNHVFNLYHDRFSETSSDGALILIEAYTWTILLWDKDHIPRFVRSRWREAGNDTNAEFEIIAKDVERLVRAYVLSEPGRIIEKIYLCAAGLDSTHFAQFLNARMRVSCIRLDMSEAFTAITENLPLDISPSALAAAVARS
jgi:hypothetical protein